MNKVRSVVREMHRILRTGGLYIVLSLSKWERIACFFCSSSAKFACAHTQVRKAGREREPGGGSPGAGGSPCFVVCRKLPAGATVEAAGTEAAALAAVLEKDI